jgi:Kef-type K+ transport system membrane component KefB
VFLLLLGGKVASKIFGMYPVVAKFRQDRNERWFYTLLMSTGLTFGTISAIYGLTNGIVSREQYSFLVAVVIASAVAPTLVAMLAFLPRHLMPQASIETTAAQPETACTPDPQTDGLADE